MPQIENKNIPSFELDHVYIVDRDDDNAERKRLREAFVKEVTLTSAGTAKFMFQLAQLSGETSTTTDSDLLTIYYDTATFKATNTVVTAIYALISDLLTQLGVPRDVYEFFKANANASQFIVPKGYIINDNIMVEAVDFPASWKFERTLVVNDANGTKTATFGPWKHNANFYGKTEIFATREEALKNHKIKVLRLTGDEDQI